MFNKCEKTRILTNFIFDWNVQNNYDSNENKAIIDSRLFPDAQLTTSTSGLYRWTKFGWNLDWCACRVLSPLRNTHDAPLGIMRKHDVTHKTGNT